ncbi:unnamed protein product [Diatraea saccharalis]|uniref:Pro-corazonin n=1 Tax=Diatraea saccharalis TaxID=40085 RepID=A0A9N9RDW4_9NEOP|nr:unnamed protein product [Diatraea saccharalis]
MSGSKGSNMLPHASLLLIFLALSSVAAQTFQYSRGWTNGKRDGLKRDVPRDIAALERIISPCQMSKLKYLLEGRPLNERIRDRGSRTADRVSHTVRHPLRRREDHHRKVAGRNWMRIAEDRVR